MATSKELASYLDFPSQPLVFLPLSLSPLSFPRLTLLHFLVGVSGSLSVNGSLFLPIHSSVHTFRHKYTHTYNTCHASMHAYPSIHLFIHKYINRHINLSIYIYASTSFSPSLALKSLYPPLSLTGSLYQSLLAHPLSCPSSFQLFCKSLFVSAHHVSVHPFVPFYVLLCASIYVALFQLFLSS